MTTAIVTDSTADLPPELLAEHNIHVIPTILIINGQGKEDGPGISRREFYEQLPKMNPLPTTAAPSSGVFQQLYETLFAQGFRQIISIHAASLLSGIFNAACVAAQPFGERVTVLDSGQVSMGLGFQALAAAEAAASTGREGLKLNAILERIENVKQRIVLNAMLDSLEYLRRSGRVSWARASLGALLQIKPFISLKDGIVGRMGEARTRRNGIERLFALLQSKGAMERLAVLHTNAEDEAHSFVERLALPFTPLVVNVTTVIGTHVGPNALGFVAVVQ